ncbi:Sodium/hydrogen exchanger 2, partial [Zea mays]
APKPSRVLLRRPRTEIELQLVRWRRTGWRRGRGPSVVGRHRHPVVGRLRRRRVRIHLRRVAALRRRRCVRPVRRHRAAARVPRNPSPSTQTPRLRTLLAPLLLRRRHRRSLYHARPARRRARRGRRPARARRAGGAARARRRLRRQQPARRLRRRRLRRLLAEAQAGLRGGPRGKVQGRHPVRRLPEKWSYQPELIKEV